VIDARSGASVYTGSLAARRTSATGRSPAPYQKVLVADFSDFAVPGEYRLLVPGLGASLPFLINDGIAMGFARTYALGLYQQRCGAQAPCPSRASSTTPATPPRRRSPCRQTARSPSPGPPSPAMRAP
jgi:hypothetical protein